MVEENNHAPGVASLARKLAATGLGVLRNRSELIAVEWQLELERLVGLLVLAAAVAFLGMMVIALCTAIVIFLFPEGARLYVAGGFALLYLGGAIWAGLCLRSLLKQVPFGETLNQLKKDREWLGSFS
jgi:uncharacterized membrane protein YqjE